MRYFTKNLWEQINSSEENIRLRAEKDWFNRNEQYRQEFNRTKRYLPRSFVKEFLRRKELHDYEITAMDMINSDGKYNCKLQLIGENEHINLILTDIKSIKIDIGSFKACVQGKLAWGYCEIERMLDKTIRLSVICDTQNELQFECKSIKFSKK